MVRHANLIIGIVAFCWTMVFGIPSAIAVSLYVGYLIKIRSVILSGRQVEGP